MNVAGGMAVLCMMMEFLKMTVSFLVIKSSIGSQTNVMDHNASNDIIDSQLNSKDSDDNDDDDDDDD